MLLVLILTEKSANTDPISWGYILFMAPLFISSGFVLTWAGIKGAQGKLPKNKLIGIRTSTTLSSDEAWKAAHKISSNFIISAGVIWMISGLALLFRPSIDTATTIIIIASMAVVVLILISAVKANKAAKEANQIDKDM